MPLFTVPESDARRFMVRAVVLRSVSIRDEAVAFAHQRRQAGEHLQILRDADAGGAAAERCAPSSAMATRRKVVSESFSGTSTTASPLASSVTRPSTPAACRTARACRPAAAAARGHRLAAVVAPADDLALARWPCHAPGALAQHGVQQIPGVVAAQREQAFVDGGERDFGAGQRRPACVTWMRALAVWRTAYCG